MRHRFANLAHDLPLLAELNHQLIRDEGHRNPMTVPELETRMRDWLESGEYRAVLFEDDTGADTLAYALYRESAEEIFLRQFFVVRHHRREGIGRRAFAALRDTTWPRGKRLSVEALVNNAPAVAFWRAVGFRDYVIGFEIAP